MSSMQKTCQNCKQGFEIFLEDFAFYEKISVPPPTWCPECRLKRRLAFVPDRVLYKRNCDLCKQGVISYHSADRDIKVYCNSCWWSDAWDPLQYGKEYDASRSFLEQLKELIRETPHVALDSNYPTLVNSKYVNHCATAKNCYLIFTTDECENVHYSEYLLKVKDSMDCTSCVRIELCYGLINCGQCYRIYFSEDSDNCRDCYFVKDCNGCSNCVGCVGLRNKSYCIFNEQLGKEEYENKLVELRLNTESGVQILKEKAKNFWLTIPRKYNHSSHNALVTGDYVYFSKNAKDMYMTLEGAEDSRYCQLLTMPGTKDAYDYTIWGNKAEQIYECMIVGEGASNIKFCAQVWPNVRDIEYSYFVHSSSYMFGCANIRSKQYCVLNKQYDKESFHKLRIKIIEDMNTMPYTDKLGRDYKYGEFFPSEIGLPAYNESYAADYFPLTKDEAIKEGFSFREPEQNPHKTSILTKDLPDSIQEAKDELTKEVIQCANCAAPYRITDAELVLLRNFNLPVPRACINCRYRERRNRINSPMLYTRECQCESGRYKNTRTHEHGIEKCKNTFETSYAPDRSEIIYCESCYQAELT